MKTIDIFKNYVCLASEKKPVYTYGAEHCHAVCSDKLVVVIPDGWEVCENSFAEILIKPVDCKYWYSVNELLNTGKDDAPYFSYHKGNKRISVELEVLDE